MEQDYASLIVAGGREYWFTKSSSASARRTTVSDVRTGKSMSIDEDISCYGQPLYCTRGPTLQSPSVLWSEADFDFKKYEILAAATYENVDLGRRIISWDGKTRALVTADAKGVRRITLPDGTLRYIVEADGWSDYPIYPGRDNRLLFVKYEDELTRMRATHLSGGAPTWIEFAPLPRPHDVFTMIAVGDRWYRASESEAGVTIEAFDGAGAIRWSKIASDPRLAIVANNPIITYANGSPHWLQCRAGRCTGYYVHLDQLAFEELGSVKGPPGADVDPTFSAQRWTTLSCGAVETVIAVRDTSGEHGQQLYRVRTPGKPGFTMD